MVSMYQARQITLLFFVSMALAGRDKLMEERERNNKARAKMDAEYAHKEYAKQQCKDAFAHSSQSPNTIMYGSSIGVEMKVLTTAGGLGMASRQTIETDTIQSIAIRTILGTTQILK